MLEISEDEAKQLAERIRPFLGAAAATDPASVEVVVARMSRRPEGGIVLAYVDLTFRAGGVDICTVKRFRWLARNDGGRWLGVPEHKSTQPNADGTDNWLADFVWENNKFKELARAAVKAAYDQPPDA